MNLIKVTIVGPGHTCCELLPTDEILARSGLHKPWESLDLGAKSRAACQAALQVGSGGGSLICVYRVAIEEIPVGVISKFDFLKLSARYEQIEQSFRRGEDSLTEAIAGKALRDILEQSPWRINSGAGVIRSGERVAA